MWLPFGFLSCFPFQAPPKGEPPPCELSAGQDPWQTQESTLALKWEGVDRFSGYPFLDQMVFKLERANANRGAFCLVPTLTPNMGSCTAQAKQVSNHFHLPQIVNWFLGGLAGTLSLTYSQIEGKESCRSRGVCAVGPLPQQGASMQFSFGFFHVPIGCFLNQSYEWDQTARVV